MGIVMTGGGTGGHLAIVAAVKEHLHQEELVYVGSTQGQDRAWFEDDKAFVKTYFLETRGVVNQKRLGRVKSLFMLVKAVFQAVQIIVKHKVKVVFSVGGFSAAPMAIASKLMFRKLVIHEQNAVLGSLNRVFKPLSHTFISSYEESSPVKAYPIKKVYFQKARVREGLETVLFLGGSQGAKAINRLALTLAPTLHKMGVAILHQAGEKHLEEVVRAYTQLGIKAEVFGFTKELPELMHKADFAIARAGASTLWELSASGVPTLYVPYPYAAGDHQYHNALFLAEQKLAWVMRESELHETEVLNIVEEAPLQEVSQMLLEYVESEGAKQIAKLLIELN
jgi:UDP-N-acetylglucosamine--N-acetylmuramyl-(pentapeptide) pyrophosphoryl-undecaprenol N-acetylglucosamine transferase